MKNLAVIVITILFISSCHTVPDSKNQAIQGNSYRKSYQVEQKDYIAQCFNLNGKSFMFKTDFKFTGLGDLGDNLLMLEYKNTYYMVQVFKLTNFVRATGLVAGPEIYSSFYEFEKAYQLKTTNFDFSEGYKIIDLDGKKYIQFTYSNPGFTGKKDEVGKVINYGWISDQYFIHFYTPISIIKNEIFQEDIVRKIITTYKAVDGPITEKNLFEITIF
jgi:hypothetical protein